MVTSRAGSSGADRLRHRSDTGEYGKSDVSSTLVLGLSSVRDNASLAVL